MPRAERLTGIIDRSSTPSVTTGSSIEQQEMKYSLTQYKRIKYIIKNHRLQPSTRKSYKKTWNRFNKFISKFDTIPPKWEDRIIVWATHLAENRKNSNTIKSYISAIRYCLSLDGIKVPHSNCELAAIVQAARQANNELYVRLPIQKGLLQLILNFIRTTYIQQRGQKYLGTTLMALYSTAYHGLFRISEMTQGQHTVKAQDIIHARNKRKMTFYLRSSKTHTTADQPQIIHIKEEQTWKANCPIRILNEYVALRGRNSAYPEQPFFMHRNGEPITQEQFRTNLKYILFTLGLPAALYGSHSFRIGKATDQKLSGKSIMRIKEDGRWATSTVFKYIRASIDRGVKINKV